MKKELISELFQQFEAAKQQNESVEFWSARDIQSILGYAQWKNFEKVVEKAKSACENAGAEVKNHFAEFGKMVDIGSGVSREINDVALTRYACYLVAQNGDATKSEIAFYLDNSSRRKLFKTTQWQDVEVEVVVPTDGTTVIGGVLIGQAGTVLVRNFKLIWREADSTAPLYGDYGIPDHPETPPGAAANEK